ncbi:MAG: hypothetical protein JW846_01165 [Dehalococcoidia bacterium]|nr:hypothetical protein [Dehalococcoidia bacterium]
MQTIASSIVPISIVTIVTAVIYVVVKVRRRQKGRGKRKDVDYRGFFTMGVVWFPLGLVWLLVYLLLSLPLIIPLPFTGIGLAYLILGLTNRDKWDKDKKRK